jgi:hypothetical protein
LSQPSGANGNLASVYSATPRFQGDLLGNYEIELTVHDGQVGSVSDIVVVRLLEQMPSAGDYDADGIVAQSDLDFVLLHWGQRSPPVPDGWVSDLPTGVIDQEELDVVLIEWGNTTLGQLSSAGFSPTVSPLEGSDIFSGRRLKEPFDVALPPRNRNYVMSYNEPTKNRINGDSQLNRAIDFRKARDAAFAALAYEYNWAFRVLSG